MSKYTSSEVSQHNTRKSLWIVIKNDVYDVTPYLDTHPGGEDPLLDAAGLDATAAFEDVGHSPNARSILKKYKIGTLKAGEACTPRIRRFPCSDDEKWGNFDPLKYSLTPKRSLSKSSTRSQLSVKKSLSKTSTRSQISLKKSASKSPSASKVIPRVPSIVVPRERRGGVCRRPPPSGSKLKWAILALAAAIIIGVAYKKYAS